MHRTLAFIGFATGVTAAYAFPTYSITDLGDVAGGGDSSFAQDINDNGVVCGVGTGPNGAVAFTWRSVAGLTALKLRGGSSQASANGIDSLGNVIGTAFTNDPLVDGHPVTWTPIGQLIDMGLPQGMSWAINGGSNDHGVVVGWGQTANGRRAFSWTSTGGYTLFPPLSGDAECGFSDISNGGTICGWSGDFGAYWKNGNGAYLAKPQGALFSFPNLITNDDRICGYVGLAGGTYNAGVWTTSGRFTQVDQLSGYPSMDCTGVSPDGGTIFGASYTDDYQRAALFNPIEGVVDMNTLVDKSTPGWVLQIALGSNKWGQVVGWGTVNGVQHGYVATPVVTPNKVTVQLGRASEGGLQALESADGNALRVCKFVVPNQQLAPVTVEVEAASPVTQPSFYLLRAVSKMDTSGQFAQTLDLFDWTAGTYSPVDTRTDALTTSYKTLELQATGDLTRYIGLGRTLRARFRIRAAGPVGSVNWCVDQDTIQFVTRP